MHEECNLSLSLSLSKKVAAVFHNLLNYDSRLILDVGKYNYKINSIPKTKKYLSFAIKQHKKKYIKSGLPLVFIGSIHHLNNSLHNLVKN